MKKITLLFFLFLCSISSYSQDKVLDVKELAKHSFSMQHLDSIYKNGLPVDDSIHPVFTQIYFDSVVDKAWNNLLQNMGKYFSKNGLKWDNPTKCWNRMYFSSTGDVDYFVYHFISPVDEKKEIEFKKVLNSFLKENKMPVAASRKFSLCRGVTWTD